MEKNTYQQDTQKNENIPVNTYMTVLTNKEYLDGIKVLNLSLIRVAAKWPLIVLVPAGIDDGILRQLDENNIAYQIVPDFNEEIFKKKIKFLIGEKHFLS